MAKVGVGRLVWTLLFGVLISAFYWGLTRDEGRVVVAKRVYDFNSALYSLEPGTTISDSLTKIREAGYDVASDGVHGGWVTVVMGDVVPWYRYFWKTDLVRPIWVFSHDGFGKGLVRTNLEIQSGDSWTPITPPVVLRVPPVLEKPWR